jgi:hypothetical protein
MLAGLNHPISRPSRPRRGRSINVKMAVVPPIPNANVSTAAAVKHRREPELPQSIPRLLCRFRIQVDGARGRGSVCAGIYSVRNASTGEMDAARLAGTRAANRAQMANALAAALSATGSQLATP